MTNCNKKIGSIMLSLLFILTSICTIQAQKNNQSPYSRFGLGELNSLGSVRSKAMGKTGIALRDKYHLNSLNPASFATIDSTSFIFDVGLTGNLLQLKSNTGQKTSMQGNFDYFTLGFSVKKWWAMSASIRKISSMGYDLEYPFQTENEGTFLTKYTGDGGINRVSFANAFQIGKNLSVGLNLNYNWGRIQKNRAILFQGNSGTPFHSEEKITVSTLNFDFGMQYSLVLEKDKKLTVGTVFSNKTKLSKDYSFIAYKNNPNRPLLEKKSTNKVALPTNFGIGLALTTKKLTLSTDVNYQIWENTLDKENKNSNLKIAFNNSYEIGVGLEYSPNRFSGRRLFDRMSYQVGTFYKKSPLEINSTSINELGVTLGLGIPIRESYMNISFELGTRGTTSENLIRENYAKINIGFTLFETWFQKVLYE